jgi:hypothetical protein
MALTDLPPENREILRKLTGQDDGILTGDPSFVDAPLDVASIAGIVTLISDDLDLVISEYLVGSAGTQALAGFQPKLLGKLAFTNPGLRTFVEISVFGSPREPGLALLQHLHGFDAAIEAAVERSTPTLGTSSFKTFRSIFWIRSNVFVRVFASGLTRRDEQLDHLRTIAQRLDEHMAANLVQLPELRKPSPEVGDDNPGTVKVGAKFVLRLKKLESTLDEKVAEVDDPSVVQWLGPMHTDGGFEFVALKSGKTTIRMTVAHSANLSQSVTSVAVSVVEL